MKEIEKTKKRQGQRLESWQRPMAEGVVGDELIDDLEPSLLGLGVQVTQQVPFFYDET